METAKLDKLRHQIDQADEALLRQLAIRLSLVKEVGEFKKQHQLPSFQPVRWQEVLEKNKTKGKELGLAEKLIADLWERIHQESLAIEAEVNEKT